VRGRGWDIEDGGQSHASDLAELENLADRFGFPTGDGEALEILRSPDSVRRAFTP
jgi:hypothetical protein